MRRDFLVSLSVANLSLWNSWTLLLYTDPSQYYYLEFPPDATYACMVILKVLLLAVLCWGAITFMRRFDNPWLLKMGKLVFMLVVATILASMRWVVGITPLLWFYALWNHIGGVAVFLIAGVGCLLCVFVVTKKFNSVVKASVVLVLILSPFVAVTFIQAGIFIISDLMSKSAGNVPVLTAQAKIIPNQSLRRVIWIIFDEMDQRLGFAERPGFVYLPEFDRLRQEGLYALNAYPPNKHTNKAMPALLTGKRVSRVVPVGPSDLEITYLGAEAPVSFKGQPNVFSRAREMSLNVACGGYYHPYYRLFGEISPSCFSGTHSYVEWKGKNRISNFFDAMYAEFIQIVPLGYRYNHARNYVRMLNYAKEVAGDERFNLVFLHFGIPHWPYIYNMEKKELFFFSDLFAFASGKGYFGNLALADITLGEIRKVLESAGLWEKTTLIVSSDHPLRQNINTYDGKFGKRVPFMLKSAGRSEAVIYEPEFNTVVTCDLVLTILDGRLSTSSDVVNWLDYHRNNKPILGAMSNP
jgi:hypothetical protein